MKRPTPAGQRPRRASLALLLAALAPAAAPLACDGRQRPRRASLALLLAALAPAAAPLACDDLARIPENTCGNRVVEEDHDEDCDGEATCAPSTSPHACRFLCDAAASPPVACPAGFGCGVDGVCRRARGTFETLLTRTSATSLDFFVGDVNADGCGEVVHTTTNGTVVTTLQSQQPGFCSAAEQTFPSHPLPPEQQAHPSPFLTDLNGNGRPELVLASEGLLSVGLRVYSSDATTALVPRLYPTEEVAYAGLRLLKVHGHDHDKLLLFLGDALEESQDPLPMLQCPEKTKPDGGLMLPDGGPPDGGPMLPDGGPPDGGPPDGGPPDGGPPGPGPSTPRNAGTVAVAGLDAPEGRTRMLGSLADGGLNGLVALRAGDVDGDGCDEVALAHAGAAEIHLYRAYPGCADAEAGLAFDPLPAGAVVTLDGIARVRSRNASIALADVNGDGFVDLVSDADDCDVHVAFGDGKGRFNSKPPPFNGPADQRTSVFDAFAPHLGDPHSILVVGKFDPAAPGSQIVTAQCPTDTQFVSDVCQALPGDCEAVVADIDDDGLDDTIATQGQQLGLLVGRAYAGGMGFHISSLDTECPPHHLTVGDFNDDGVNDIAFTDQAGLTGASHRVLKVAYGRAQAAPEAPRLEGLLDGATGLVSGRFAAQVEPQTAPVQLYASRGFAATGGQAATSAISLLAGNAGGEIIAPLYVPDVLGSGDGAQLANLEILAATAGGFVTGGTALAVVAREAGKAPALWLLSQEPGDGRLVNVGTTALTGLDCAACLVAAARLDGGGRDALLVLDGQDLVVFTAGDAGFTEQHRQTLDHAVGSIHDAGNVHKWNPARYVPRPLVLDRDGDGEADLVVARAQNRDLVALWREASGGFTETTLLAATDCGHDRCAGLAIAPVRVPSTSDGTATRADLAEPKFAVVGPGLLGFYRLQGRELTALDVHLPAPVLVPDPGTDFVAVGAADLDGDGIDDLAVMPSGSSIHIFRGIPVHP
jgi:hypothetical protein